MSKQNKKIIITGVGGFLGNHLTSFFKKQGAEIIGTNRSELTGENKIHIIELDLLENFDPKKIFQNLKPETFIHCAAITNVDECEKNPELTYKINSFAAQKLAEFCFENEIKFVFISTDQLWNGKKKFITENETTSPINVYGKSKAMAEALILKVNSNALIIRTNFFGFGKLRGKSILDWIVNNLNNGDSISGFEDVFFTPISIVYFSDFLNRLLLKDASGIYHLGGSERISKYDFAKKVADFYDLNTNLITPISIDKIEMKADRPKDMSLSSAKIAFELNEQMPDILNSLKSIHNKE